MATALISGAFKLMEKLKALGDLKGYLLQLKDILEAMTTDIEGKMEELKHSSMIIDEAIQDLESRPFIDDAVKDLLKELKYLARDVEDAVDYYDTKVLPMQQRSNTSFEMVRDFFSSDNPVVLKSKVGVKIKGITERLNSILRQKSILLDLPQGSIRMSEPSLRRETHSCNSCVVIGREPEKNKIINMLTKDDDDESNNGTVKVIAIVGMGGLGKTTLAQLVFHDEKVKAHFASSRMWKVVGAEFDPVKLMKSVLELATDTDAPVNISETDLVRQKIEKALSGKRFLLVLDDVGNEDPLKWNDLKAALTCGARGSKILVTTRSQQVSSIMGSSNTTHQIQQLSRDDCLSLFRQFAFGEEAADQKLMEIGEKIADKCGGVPLAAISLGSMLRGTRDQAYWSSVSNSQIWKLGEGEQKVLSVLQYSYDTLHPRSKQCFAFGSLFPKDYMMQKDQLVKLWIANGFVSSEGKFEAETVGNRVFDDLVLRSFFLLSPFEDDPHVTVTHCSMHDLMHDLARSVSRNAYWNSIQDSVEDIVKGTCHLQIVEGHIPNMAQVFGKKSLNLHTFMSLMPRYSSSLSINLPEVFTKLKYLRALDLTSCGIREIPTSIEDLKSLRYLNLNYNNIEVLPDSITSLLNLQYLNLGFNHELRELPKKLVNMQNLRDLDLEEDHKLTHMPCGLSRLTNLRSLPLFIASDKTGACSITELEDLKLHGKMQINFSYDFNNYSPSGRKILKNKYLNELCIEFHGSGRYHKDIFDDLCPNTSLEKLTILNYQSPQFPTWFIELQVPNLVEVCLDDCSVYEHIPPFGNLLFLKKLHLCFMNGITQMGTEFYGNRGFPFLKKLFLCRMSNLEEWTDSDSVEQLLFPSLQIVQIFCCPKLKSMPRLPRIQELEISDCSRNLLSCIGRLTSLSFLRVSSVKDLASLPNGCIRNLTSLTELKISECRELQSLPGDEMQHLEKLRSLTIESCDNLASFPLEMGCLSSLSFLSLRGCPSIIVQPQVLVQIVNSLQKFQIEFCYKNVNMQGQLQYLRKLKELFTTGVHGIHKNPSYIGRDNATQFGICCCDELESLMTAESAVSSVLEELYIDGISNLTKLPDWLQHLKFLRVLLIQNCPQLERVPSDLKNLHMLETLRIIGCPQLESRCAREAGEDWLSISHVQNVDIRSFPLESRLTW